MKLRGECSKAGERVSKTCCGAFDSHPPCQNRKMKMSTSDREVAAANSSYIRRVSGPITQLLSRESDTGNSGVSAWRSSVFSGADMVSTGYEVSGCVPVSRDCNCDKSESTKSNSPSRLDRDVPQIKARPKTSAERDSLRPSGIVERRKDSTGGCGDRADAVTPTHVDATRGCFSDAGFESPPAPPSSRRCIESHPAGSRVSDLVDWAEEILRIYKGVAA